MKKSAKNRIIIWSIVSAILMGIIVVIFVPIIHHGNVYYSGFDTYDEYDGYDCYTEETSGKLSYNSYDVYDLTINVSNGNVILKSGTSDLIEIYALDGSTDDEPNNYKNFYYKYCDSVCSLVIYGSEEDRNLENQDYTSNMFDFENLFSNISNKTIVVEIPTDSYLNSITVNTAAADITVKNITNDLSLNTYSGSVYASNINLVTISVNNISGDINFEKSTAESISINTVSGKTELDGNFKETTFESVSGDLYYSNASSSNYLTAINTVSGNAYLELPENLGFVLDSTSVSGSVISELKGKYTDDGYVYGDESADIDFSSVSGSITLKPLKNDNTEQEKAKQKENENKEAATSPTPTVAQTQPATSKSSKHND